MRSLWVVGVVACSGGKVTLTGPILSGEVPRLVKCAVIFVLLVMDRHALASPFDLRGSDWEGCAELVRLATAELEEMRAYAGGKAGT